MRWRSLWRRLLKLNGCLLLLQLGMTGLVPLVQFAAQLGATVGLVAEHVLRRLHATDETLRERKTVCSPPVSKMAMRRP
jgi:riboflavin synthase